MRVSKFVAAEMVKYALHPDQTEPILVDVDTCLVSFYNRGGGPLNMPYVHLKLCKKSIGTDGYDPKRPRPAVAIHYEDKELILKLQDHNLKFMEGNNLYPPIFKDKAVNATLASSHLFCGHRLFKNCCKSEFTGYVFEPNAWDTQHVFLLENGAPCYLLKQGLPATSARVISDYYNSDQNDNKVFDEDGFFVH